MRKVNRKTLAKRGGGSGTTSASAGHNVSAMPSGTFKGTKVRTKPSKPSGVTKASQRTARQSFVGYDRNVGGITKRRSRGG
jgi:hypothetical protein